MLNSDCGDCLSLGLVYPVIKDRRKISTGGGLFAPDRRGIKPQPSPSKPDSHLDTAETDDKVRDTLVSIVVWGG